MTKQYCLADERGVALIHMTLYMVLLLMFSGLAIDGGRAYVVKAQLSKAVDGAALGAARMLNSGNPRQEAGRIFKANFPVGFMGSTSVTDPSAPGFYTLETVAATGVNIVTVRATAVVPTSLMRLGNFGEVTVSSMGEAQRRMLDLSLVLDVSSSIGSKWGAVRDAAREFVRGFDAQSDRMALVTYSNHAAVPVRMSNSRGFDKNAMIAAIPNSLPGGSTAMVEGLYQGWDELRTVLSGQQSGLRVIVLFTDGASNSVPGQYPGNASATGLRTYDFPKNNPDPDGQTWMNPKIEGLFVTNTGAASPSVSITPSNWESTQVLASVPFLPERSWHQHGRSSGIPSSFPLETNALTVDGVRQKLARGLRHWNAAALRYPAEVWNINNAARNLLEIIADASRSDNGDYPIRIYTIGMGELVRYNLGTRPEKPESILKRIANDRTSPDYNQNQVEGKYYFAQTEQDVGPAFQQVQSQIIRLSK